MSTAPRTGPTLPAGFTVQLAEDTLACGRLLVGGSGSVLRLRPRALAMLGPDGTLVSRDPTSASVARTLLDRGLANPRFDTSTRSVGDVTVVVPVRDRTRQVARLLATLHVQLPGVPVVVVDDGSCDPDALRAVAAEHGARLLCHARSAGPAAARNTGLAAASTRFVAFLDSDVVPVPGWLEVLLRHLDDPAVAVVGPRVLGTEPGADDSWLSRYEAARSSLDLGPVPAPVQPLGRVAYLPSAALLARRSALVSGPVTGFDERLEVAEDVDLVWRLLESGWRVRYEPAAVVRHEHRSSLGAWLRRKAFYGTGAALLAARHGSNVAPMVLTPWTAALTVAVLAQRRWSLPVALLTAGAATVGLARRLEEQDQPVRTAARLTAFGTVAALRQCAGALTRHYWPVAALAAVRGPRARRALLVAAVLDGVLDHRRVRPDLDVARFVVARRLDDLAYGAGLWQGAWRARSVRALLPLVRGLPVPARRPRLTP